VGARGGIAFFGGELLQCTEVFDFTLQILKWIDEGAQSGDLIDVSLSALAIRPKIGRGHAPFDYG
jgi:hypothetical protein